MAASRFAASWGLVLVIFSLAVFGQANSIDPGFVPVPSLEFDDAVGKGLVIQPDGKILIFGGNLVVDGFAKGEIARLNTDGTIDNTFSYCGCLLASVSNVAVQADGRILVAGNQNSRAKVVRLNSDGTHDSTFVTSLDTIPAIFSSATVNTIQPDGKILVQMGSAFELGFHSGVLMRLNTNGTIDSGFTSITYDSGRLISGSLTALALDPSGKIYLAIRTSSGMSWASVLRRHNADGTQDSAWIQPSFSPSTNSEYNGLAVEPDGSLLISGRFDTVNGLSKQNLVRILPAGNVDPGFTPPFLGTVAGQLVRLPDSKILVAYHLTGTTLITKLKSDGTSDPTFGLSPSVLSVFSRFVVDSMGRILFFGASDTGSRYFRLNVNGSEDMGFNPNVTKFGTVHSLAQQPDGKIILAGRFTQLNGVERATIGRVNSDGTLDTTFDPGTGFDQPPTRLIVQADGKIIAAGGFTTYNGSSRPGLIRLNADGSIDGSFDPPIDDGAVLTASVQSDGKILIGGTFTSIGATSRTGAARLTSTGGLDGTFNVIVGSPAITEIFQQADGKIMLGGGFNGVNGFNRSGMVRLNNDGSLDLTFDATGVGSVVKIYVQADGKYVVLGAATLRRRLATGGADPTFASPTFSNGSNQLYLDDAIVQPDGTVIVGGRFETVNGISRRNIVRLTSAGTLDPVFLPSGADGRVRGLLRQSDGKVVVGGEFGKIENVIRSGIARLTVAPFHFATPFDFDGDGRADISVVRPTTNRWYEVLSSTGGVHEESFGIEGDIPVPADFDGDGVTDEAVYRPSNGQWWFRSSLDGGIVLNQFGSSIDIPRPSDFDGDGKADLVLFKPSNSTWHRFSSLTRQASATAFGIPGDQPLVGDFDGDGKADLAVFRPSTGDWWYAATSANGAFRTMHWGQNGDIPVPADYDGDRKTDLAVFRPSDGGWYIYNSGDGSFTILAFGTNGDRPIAADYDGDGRADIGVFRPSTGIWYLYRTTAGFAGYQFGISTDVPLPGSLIP